MPAPNDPPISTVSFGTSAVATAVTIFAPSFAIPDASASRPTMNPVMFWRNTSGIRRCAASSMKCAPLSADVPNRIPSLARIPTGQPSRWANPQTSVSP